MKKNYSKKKKYSKKKRYSKKKKDSKKKKKYLKKYSNLFLVALFEGRNDFLSQNPSSKR
eukprot:CAMPEP_0201497010 /NCGR_PEP_ID=MMETSP0151_2-20130828/63101_1 /ASSEMBLY_ACC=CAM_ASM_000257 /TAXON_ID=200890 /ORGANISM="Paramoeba atlantica, Strain 621/1 / CCAP 1560/9" /LENGTH=58 /DNA_ID=CAMNT_0047887293 /DNA_START=111 /DNA_END=287 /DNA_ORIENTATION=+